MLVTLIGKNGIHKIRLPQNPIGNYWLKDETQEVSQKLVNIEGIDDNWQIITNKYIKAINPKALIIENDKIRINNDTEVVVDRVILKEHNMYGICLGSAENLYIIYCAPAYEDDYYHFDIRNTNEVFIGRSVKDDIVYDNKLVANTHARIFYDRDKWVLENFDRKFGTFVNNQNIGDKSRPLKNGDIIYIMGLKIIIMGDSIYINHPLQKVKFNSNKLVLNKKDNDEFHENEKNETQDITLYKEEDYFKRAPRLINIIEEKKISIEPPPAKKEDSPISFVAVLATSLTMCLTMIINIIRVTDRICK